MLVRLCVAPARVPFLMHAKPIDQVKPLLAPPSDWVQELMRDGVNTEEAREAYLRQLMGLLSGMVIKCDTTILSKSDAELCIYELVNGKSWGTSGLSPHAVTMAGHKRMRSVAELIALVASSGLKGSFAETGVWRGGMSIFAQAALQLYGLGDRPQYLCDSFDGVPNPRKYSMRQDETGYRGQRYLHVNEHHVLSMFQRYGVRSQMVKTVKGWYSKSMPGFRAELQSRGERLAILRLDGDIYDSTIDVLYNLYDLVEVGGFIIIDDFGFNDGTPGGGRKVYGARDAMLDFRAVHEIEDDAHFIRAIDGNGAWFTKARGVELQRHRYVNHMNSNGSDAYAWMRPHWVHRPRGDYYSRLRERWIHAATANQSRKLPFQL